MTIEEKILIESQDVGSMYRHYHLINPLTCVCDPAKMINFNEFRGYYNGIVTDGGHKLRQQLYESSSVSVLSLFEIPKGIVKQNEDPLAAAKRELQEETNYCEFNYTIIYEHPLRFTFIAPDNHVTYNTDYYVALVNNSHHHNQVKITDWSQKIEIGEIRWFPISLLPELWPHYKNLSNQIQKIITQNRPEIVDLNLEIQGE